MSKSRSAHTLEVAGHISAFLAREKVWPRHLARLGRRDPVRNHRQKPLVRMRHGFEATLEDRERREGTDRTLAYPFLPQAP